MFPDLLFILHNLGPEVRFASGVVAFNIQIESEEMGKARNRKHASNEGQIWNTAGNSIETPP